MTTPPVVIGHFGRQKCRDAVCVCQAIRLRLDLPPLSSLSSRSFQGKPYRAIVMELPRLAEALLAAVRTPGGSFARSAWLTRFVIAPLRLWARGDSLPQVGVNLDGTSVSG